MKAIQTVLLDTNVILRFFLHDHPEHFKRAKALFERAENGLISCYIDPVILAEVVWTLSSFYKVSRGNIATKLETLLVQQWAVSDQKQAMLSAIHWYQETTLDYIDCWLLAISEEKHMMLETFDVKLKKQEKTSVTTF